MRLFLHSLKMEGVAVGGLPEQDEHRCVLLVEDEAPLRGVLARYLRAQGHEVVEAQTAAVARSALDSGSFDVLLLDVNLPDDTGWSVLRWLKDRRRDGERGPRVIVLSAIPPSSKRVAEFAPDAVLNKPFPIDALGRLVQEYRDDDDIVPAGRDQ